MAGPVGALGPLVFVGGLGSVFTLHELTKKKKNSFVKHRIIAGNDLIEDTGSDPIEVDIQMRFYAPYTADPSVSLTLLETLMDSKVPVPLIIGGTPIGRGILTLFVVEDISSKMPKFRGGRLTVLDATVKLLEYPNGLSIAGPLGSLANTAFAVLGNLF